MFAISMNCLFGGESVGGGEDGTTTVDIIGTVRSKVEVAILERLSDSSDADECYVIYDNHPWVGLVGDLGKVVGVVTETNDNYNIAVVLELDAEVAE